MSLPLPKKLAEDLARLNARYKPDAGAGGEGDGSASAAATGGSNPVRRSFILDDSVENAMFDSILGGSRPGSSYARNISSVSAAGSGGGGAGSRPSSSRSEDREFNNAILTRLQKAEAEISTLRRDYAKLLSTHEKTKSENRELHRQLKALGLGEYDLEALLEENRVLSDQVVQMEAFLRDYGLAWVGGDNQLSGERGSDQSKSSGKPTSSTTPERMKKTGAGQVEPSDFFKQFKEKVEELNTIIRSEPAQVKMDASGSLRRGRIVHADEAVQSLKLTVFKNGILIRRGPFREIGSPSYASFVRDIMDGYFPGELQAENPDGVIIDLHDMSSEDYDEQSVDKMTGFQLIKRLPKQVVRNGEIIDIQGDIAKKLGESSSVKEAKSSDNSKPPLGPAGSGSIHVSKSMSSEPSNAAMRSSREVVNLNYQTWLSEKTSANEHSSKGMLNTALFSGTDAATERGGVDGSSNKSEGNATVQVKWGASGTTFILTMPKTCIVNDIRGMLAHCQGYWTEEQAQSFELRSAFPPKILENSATLAEVGLVPNGTVHAKLLNT